MCTFGSNFRQLSLIFVNYNYDFKINIKIINKAYYCDCHYGFPMWDHPKYIPTQSQYRTKPFSHWNPTLQKNEKKRKKTKKNENLMKICFWENRKTKSFPWNVWSVRLWSRLSFSSTPLHLGATGGPMYVAFKASPTLFKGGWYLVGGWYCRDTRYQKAISFMA